MVQSNNNITAIKQQYFSTVMQLNLTKILNTEIFISNMNQHFSNYKFEKKIIANDLKIALTSRKTRMFSFRKKVQWKF